MTTSTRTLPGVYAAVVTPLTAHFAPDLGAMPALLDFLYDRGCHGAVLLGTTGEGPSFSVGERLAVVRTAAEHRDRTRPDMRLIAGTGCANLTDTIDLTRGAFDLGVDAVLALPAFYFKGVGAAGIAAYFEAIVAAAVPSDGRLLVYHIPQVSGVAIPDEAVARLRARYPHQVWGMKDSQDHLPHTQAVLRDFPGFGVFAGSDTIMSDALAAGGVGAITALANITSPLNRQVWDAHQQGTTAPEAQARLSRARQTVAGLGGSAAMKFALSELFGFPQWPVRPPLDDITPEAKDRLARELRELLALQQQE
jgi:4-hydroxy-tetrahydrodipicolinate synthase